MEIWNSHFKKQQNVPLQSPENPKPLREKQEKKLTWQTLAGNTKEKRKQSKKKQLD
jgi:hypothetical protein